MQKKTINAYFSTYISPVNNIAQEIMSIKVSFTAVGKTNIIAEAFTTEYESAVAFGRAELIEDREEKLSAILKICEKYTPEHMEQAVEYAQRTMDAMHICRIRIEHITGKARVGK